MYFVLRLACRAVGGLVFLALVVGLVLFGVGGTGYWQAWGFLASFLIPALLITIYLWRRDPALLQRRVDAGPTSEREPIQKVIQGVASLAFIALLVVPSLDHRYSWSHVTSLAIALGNAAIVAGYVIVFLVFRENTYTSATVEVAAAQHVVDTGPYRIVRHPMYAGALLLLAGISPALGSWWGCLALTPMIGVIVARLINEESFLRKKLNGYADHCERVPHRLLPGIW